MSRSDVHDGRGVDRPGVAAWRTGAAGLLFVSGRATGSDASASAGVGGGSGTGALVRALVRWRRVVRPERPAGSTGPVGPGAPPAISAPVLAPVLAPAADVESVATLARRLDDSGCSYGRVSAAKLEQVIRAYDRLETKLNAVLMAVTGTFLSTLAGLLLYYVRGGGQ